MNKTARIILNIFVAALIFSMISISYKSSSTHVTNAHPQLVELASENPDQLVRVIAQKTDNSGRAEKMVTHLGGQITQDLHIINAFAAQLSAKSAVELAQMSTVSWVSLDGAVISTGKSSNDPIPSAYIETTGAAWVHEDGYDGNGVTVAVVDSGMIDYDDMKDAGGSFRMLEWVQYADSTAYHFDDYYGHGAHIAGTIGGTGELSNGAYKGMAPDVDFVGVKVSNDQGMGYASDVVAGLQWVLDHKDQYNIRVVNLSINSSVAESYHTNPLCAAVEILWFNEIVVVVSAGNNGTTEPGVLLPPANDPFVITVGALDDQGTGRTKDDTVAPFTPGGVTQSGFNKPDLLAPGVDIVALRGKPDAVLAVEHPKHIVNTYYFRMSGTSMAAAVTSGAVALLLDAEPNLTPDQVKYRLTHSFDDSYTVAGLQNIPSLNIYNAIYENTNLTESANTGIDASQLLWTGGEPVTWSSVGWNSVNWNAVNWNAVNWNSVVWDD